jgi:hypothetical protein
LIARFFPSHGNQSNNCFCADKKLENPYERACCSYCPIKIFPGSTGSTAMIEPELSGSAIIAFLVIELSSALEYLDGHELHGSGPLSCSAQTTVQLLHQVKINQHSSRISFTLGVMSAKTIVLKLT